MYLILKKKQNFLLESGGLLPQETPVVSKSLSQIEYCNLSVVASFRMRPGGLLDYSLQPKEKGVEDMETSR